MKTQTLPDWYTTEIPVENSTDRFRRRAGYVRRGLASLGEVLARELTTPVCASSWLGKIEPRAKLVGIFLLVFGSTFLHTLSALSILLISILLMTLSIRLPVKSLARVWLGVPLFSLALILPATTNLVTHGQPVLLLFHFKQAIAFGSWIVPNPLAVTDTGLVVAGRFLLRSVNCVTLCYLLIASTDSMLLLNGLRRLGMPKVFGMVLTMSQRYLAVIIRAAEEIHLSKLSRTITAGPIHTEQRWVAAGMGMLFRRTQKLAVEVQNSMASRGYDGDLQVRSRISIQMRDIAWILVICSFTVVLIIVDNMHIWGR